MPAYCRAALPNKYGNGTQEAQKDTKGTNKTCPRLFLCFLCSLLCLLCSVSDPVGQSRWQHEKGMLGLNFRTSDGSIEVDLLVSESHQFEGLHQRAAKVTIDGRSFFVASIDDLIAMKERVGRRICWTSLNCKTSRNDWASASFTQALTLSDRPRATASSAASINSASTEADKRCLILMRSCERVV